MAQFARPDADQATGKWGSTPLWSKVNEGSPGDDTTISSDDNTSPDNADLRLSDVTDPESASGHIIRVAWNKDSSGGHTLNPAVELWEGVPGTGTLRATLSVSDLGSTEQTDTYTLSTAEANNITDYTDLYLRVQRIGDTGGNPNGRRFLVVDFVEFEVPDSPAQNFTQTVSATGTGSATLARKTAKSLNATGTGSATLTASKKSFKTLAVTATGSAALATALTIPQSLAATATGTAALTRKIGKGLSATASGAATLARKIGKVVSATAVGSAALTASKKTLQSLNATATGTPVLSTAATVAQGVSASGIGTASLATEFTAGGGSGKKPRSRTLGLSIGGCGRMGALN